MSVEERPVVLCVDDESAVLSALRRALRHEPYDVLVADSPSAALECVRSRAISVVVCDQRMPDMTGAELLCRLAEVSPATARLMLTGYPDGALIEGCRKDGIQCFISKPWSDDGLRQALRDALRERELAPGFMEIC